MLALTQPRLAQIAAALVASASWLSLGLFVLLFVAPSRPALFVGLTVCVLVWAAAICAVLPLRCPHCGKRIGVTVTASAGPNWALAKEQFLPVEALVRKQVKCPHCGSVSSLRVHEQA
jgi:DNA-directed RNA polymerase subunit RPC12/RpoP